MSELSVGATKRVALSAAVCLGLSACTTTPETGVPQASPTHAPESLQECTEFPPTELIRYEGAEVRLKFKKSPDPNCQIPVRLLPDFTSRIMGHITVDSEFTLTCKEGLPPIIILGVEELKSVYDHSHGFVSGGFEDPDPNIAPFLLGLPSPCPPISIDQSK